MDVTQKKALRQKIFDGMKRKRIAVTYNGVEMEIQQPTIAQVMDLHDTTNPKQRIAKSMIEYCYYAGTDEKVFEDTDLDQLMDMPFSEEVTKMQEVLTQLMTGKGQEEARKN